MTRRAVPKWMRFEVFKRDHFTCTYCGAKAPEAVLECDHVTPVFHDGHPAQPPRRPEPRLFRAIAADAGARLVGFRKTGARMSRLEHALQSDEQGDGDRGADDRIVQRRGLGVGLQLMEY